MDSGKIGNNSYLYDSFSQNEESTRNQQAISRPATAPLFDERYEYQSPIQQDAIVKPIAESDVKSGDGANRALLQKFRALLWDAFNAFVSIFYSRDYLNKEQGKKELAPLITITAGAFPDAKNPKDIELVKPLNQQCMSDWTREGVRVFDKKYLPDDLKNKSSADFNKSLADLTDDERGELEKGTENFQKIRDGISGKTSKLMVLWAGRFLNQQAFGAFTEALSKLPIGPNGEKGWIPKNQAGSIQKYEIDKIGGKNENSLKLTFEYRSDCTGLMESNPVGMPRNVDVSDGSFVHVKFSIILHLDASQRLSDEEFDAKKDDKFYQPTVTVDEIEIFDFKFNNITFSKD